VHPYFCAIGLQKIAGKARRFFESNGGAKAQDFAVRSGLSPIIDH
jgi:hypothetical protein